METLTAFFLVVVTFIQGLLGIKSQEPVNNPLPVLQTQAVPIKVTLIPTSTNFEIHLKAINQNISTLALRFVYQYEGLPGKVVVTPNFELTQNNWMFPIRKSEVVPGKKIMNIDLAAAVISPTGFVLNGDIILGQVTIPGLTKENLNQISLDPNVSKAYTKATEEIPIKLE